MGGAIEVDIKERDHTSIFPAMALSACINTHQ